MTHFILHREGAYNVWSTVVDAPLYDTAMTLEELKSVIPDEGIQEKLANTHATGCSAKYWNLAMVIAMNRAGKNESHIPKEEFVKRFLTLSSDKQPRER